VTGCRARPAPRFDEAGQGFDKARRASYIASRINLWIVSAMQRVRIGLTGLAFVFVAVLLAAALTSAPAGEVEITPNSIERNLPSMPSAAGRVAPTEPLAELGVAPGRADANTVISPAPPAQ
jgi:hypothetical protein